jgi:hypothetical protein
MHSFIHSPFIYFYLFIIYLTAWEADKFTFFLILRRHFRLHETDHGHCLVCFRTVNMLIQYGTSYPPYMPNIVSLLSYKVRCSVRAIFSSTTQNAGTTKRHAKLTKRYAKATKNDRKVRFLPKN